MRWVISFLICMISLVALLPLLAGDAPKPTVEQLQAQLAQLQKENAVLKSYVTESDAYKAKDSRVMNAALIACMGQPPAKPAEPPKPAEPAPKQ